MTTVQSQSQSTPHGVTRLIPGGKSLERTQSTNSSVKKFVNPSRVVKQDQPAEQQLDLFDRI